MVRYERSVTTAPDASWGSLRGDTAELWAAVTSGSASYTVSLSGLAWVQIGRSEDADLQISDATMSRVHARVRLDEALLTVTDQSSRNGTYVHERRCPGTARIAFGQAVRMGETRLVFLRRFPEDAWATPVMSRRSFLQALDEDTARGESPLVWVLRLSERWNELAPIRDVLREIAPVARIGIYSDRILAFSASGARAVESLRATLRLFHAATLVVHAGIGTREVVGTDARSLLSAALENLLAGASGSR